MQQSKTSSARLLRKILLDLKNDISNYTNQYVYLNSNVNALYPSTVDKLKNMAEQAILDKEYSKAITYYNRANEYIDNQEYKFDVQILFLNRIIDYIEANKSNILLILKNGEDISLEAKDNETYLFYKKHELKLINASVNELCCSANSFIENRNHVLADSILDIAQEKDLLHKYDHVISYLRVKNTESLTSRIDDTNNNEISEEIIESIRICIENECYDSACEIAHQGLNVTNNPIFYYYLGKIYYKKRDLDLALEHFNIYKSISINKYPKVQIYMYHIYLVQKRKKDAMELIKNTLELESMFGDFNFQGINTFPIDDNEKKNNDEWEHDLKPYRLLRRINVCEEEFLKRD